MQLVPHQQARHARRGVALVIVLAFLVLLSTLIIAFFSSVQLEAQSSANYGASVAAKQLVQSALHVAMGQVSDATKSTKVPGSTSAADRIAWASQPGMIRTWDAEGNGWKIFKLYSAKSMVEDFAAGGYSTADKLAAEIPDGWAAQPALYTDLNSPVLVSDATGQIDRNGAKFRAEYPIIDPLALGVKSDLTDRVEGFNLAVAPGYAGPTSTDPKTGLQQPAVTLSTDPSSTAQVGKSANPAPMPVVWIYVLKDGTLTVPTGSSGRIATWSGGQYAPTATNPIVGRVAFWGDDESCKLNLNTASEPTPWDTPRMLSRADLNYGTYQPAKKEYQRFAGHPFMTALSPVFFPNQTVTNAQKQSIYGVIPRIVAGGSQSATVNVTGAAVLTPDGDRLFANVDEFIFQPSRAENTVIDPERLKRARFFLTANSRAPEVSLFGGPRISIWPENSNANLRTPFDKLAAFCATIGSATNNSQKAYYFQRSDSTSPTADYTGIPRNKELYSYLQTLTSQKTPGFGGDLKSKWGNDRDQVLTEIFDYIRCVNLRDTQAGATLYASNGQVAPITIGSGTAETKGFGRFHSISQFGLHFICSQQYDKGQYSKLTPGYKLGSAGSGPKDQERFVEAAFLFEPFSPSMGFYKLSEDMYYEVTFSGAWTLDMQPLDIGGPPGTKIGKNLNNGIGQGYHSNGREHGGTGGIRGPVQYFVNNSGGKYPFVSTTQRIKVGGPGKDTMDFKGGDIEVKVYSGSSATAAKLVQTFNVTFPDGKFPVPELATTGTEGYRDNGGANAPTTQEIWWTFNGFGSYNGRYREANSVPQAPGEEYLDPARRWDVSGNGGSGQKPGFKKGSLFRREDIVRSIVPEHGDLRLVAANTNPGKNDSTGASKFVKVRSAEWEQDFRFLHIFSNNSGPHFHFGFSNEPNGGVSPATNPKDIPGSADDDQLTWNANVKYHYSRLPSIRPGAGKQYNKWGDFDNGVAQWMDGAYINKPDEGNISATNSPFYYFSWNDSTNVTEVFFSPNRLVPSAGMFGSLPTGVKRNQPWQTLLFRPQKNHPGDPGYATPATGKNPTNKAPDHLIMDLFWMPFAEPYAISEPFSTAGKVNMNYEIAPFSYIRRATAMHGVLKAEEPLAIPNAASKIYKLWDHETNDNSIMPNNARDKDAQVRTDWDKAYNGQAPFDKVRLGIDADLTLSQFEARFKAGEIFRSATQICETHLVRKGDLLSEYESGDFWTKKNILTGDNTRERPYTNIYSRLTTKSNVFTIHVRAQVLRKATNTNATQWDEDKDRVMSEHRGSTIIERYIDAAATNLPDFASPASADATLDANYRFRMVATKKFAP